MMSAIYKLKGLREHPAVDRNNHHLMALPRLYSPNCLSVDTFSSTNSSSTPGDNVTVPPEEISCAFPSSSVDTPALVRLGICAMDEKVLSKPNQEIFRRLQANGDIEIVYFDDQVLLEKPVGDWPICDSVIAFYSNGFPLGKAISYIESRSPICYNDLLMQELLLDRRLCHRVLDSLGIRTPKRLEVNRDGGPRAPDWKLARHVNELLGLRLPSPEVCDNNNNGMRSPATTSLSEDGNTLFVDGRKLHKPFVEKPASAENHNIYIYFPSTPQGGGGGRRLFRRIGDKCSEYDPSLVTPRCITEHDNSYVYEPLLNADSGEDIKAYAVGPNYCLALTRRSPVVSGDVVREANGKERRQITALTKEEAEAASKIAVGFGQALCGFDIVRNNGKSYVIDVNGWTSVKNQPDFYERSSDILRQMLISQLARENQGRKMQEHTS